MGITHTCYTCYYFAGRAHKADDERIKCSASEEQVTTFIDMTEKFMLTVIDNRMIPCTENASKLNKMRQLYETFLIVISGITVATDTTDSMSCPDCGAGDGTQN